SPRSVEGKVGVLQYLCRDQHRQAYGVGPVLPYRRAQWDDVAKRLAHLFSFHEHRAVDDYLPGPVVPFKDGDVVEYEKREMVWHEVASRVARVDWIEVLKLGAYLFYCRHAGFFGDLACVALPKEHIIKERVRDCLGVGYSPVVDILGYRVIGHIDYRVRQTFDYPFRVPRKLRAKARLACTRPFAQPVEDVVELLA